MSKDTGVRFDAYKDAVQQYSGPAMMLRKLKSGLYLCQGKDGTQFQETKTKILQSLNANKEPGDLEFY